MGANLSGYIILYFENYYFQRGVIASVIELAL